MEEYLQLLRQNKKFKVLQQKDFIQVEFDFLAKPGSKLSFIKFKKDQQQDGGLIVISVTAKPVDGEANEAFISIIADEFGVTKSDVEIIRGLKGKSKTVKITVGETKSRPWKKRIEDLKRLLCQLD